MMEQIVTVTLDGGLVQAVFINGVPEPYIVVDYDVEGADPDEITRDLKGQECHIGAHRATADEMPITQSAIIG